MSPEFQTAWLGLSMNILILGRNRRASVRIYAVYGYYTAVSVVYINVTGLPQY
jgi:hypothetical protein